MIGKTILHYKILEKLGEGGMGIVYKAEDTKLERTVALKFLPTNTLTGEEEKKRFKREARAAAALNHANICHVYAIDEADDQLFIAMEFIEGQSLAEMIHIPVKPPSKGDLSDSPFEGGRRDVKGGVTDSRPLPIPDAINYATQIATGLQAAHEKGITHRDIKSANIMVTDKRVVKIMDFGLAKLGDRSMMTKEGTTLGTAAYMSPEQAQGQKVDHRSDIWSLGVVLYEMISGRLPFKGEYEQSVIYSIVNEEPEPLTALRSALPIALDGIIAKALAKDPAVRYQHVDELPADLKALDTASLSRSRISTSRTPSALPQSAIKSQPSNRWLSAAVMVILSLIVGAAVWFLKPEPTPMVARLSIVPHAGDRIYSPTISPDGRFIAYSVRAGGEYRIHLRRLDQGVDRAIPGSEGGDWPFFSPDSRWLGFSTWDKIKKVPVTGGSPIPITNALYSDPSWGPDETIIYSAWLEGFGRALFQVSASGGTPELLIRPDTSKKELRYDRPRKMSDGKSVLFDFWYNATSKLDSNAVAVLDLATRKYEVIIEHGGGSPSYSPTGHLLWLRWKERQLLAAPFDLDKRKITGPAVPIAQGVGQYAFSSNGSLVYTAGWSGTNNRSLVWLDKQGQETIISPIKGNYQEPRLSPDGRRIALARTDENDRADIFVYDLALGKFDQLTFQGENRDPTWTPDGQYVTYTSGLRSAKLLTRKADGSTAAKEIWSGDFLASPSWSPDGKWLLFDQYKSEDDQGFWAYSAEQDNAEKLIVSSAYPDNPRLSPNGKWIAYESFENGISDTYVMPFPDTGGRWKISESGGYSPIWSRDGKMLYYSSEKNELMGIRVQIEPVFAKLGVPEVLFTIDEYISISDVHPDGDRFLARKYESIDRDAENEIHVVLNWFEELKRLAPTGK